ncbi:MAG: SPOR domain-containing protein, partial [Crocinitomicaceae bacterium]|nr:SPOR domain-containing protein [Crocinitomicaceae bacterium]
IAAKEGWEENDAVNLIAKYVREIEAKLNIGESYDMYRFGSFKKDNTGDVNFEAWIGESPSVVNVSTTPLAEVSDVESVGVIEEQIVSEPVIEKAEELAIETIIEAVPEPIIIQVEPAEVIVEEEVQPIITIEADSIDVIEPVSEFEEAEKTATEINPIIEKEAIIEEVETIQYTEEDQWKDDLDLPPINAKIERPKKPIIEKAKSDKKKRHPAFYILTVLIVILIGGSVTVGVFYDQLKQHLPFVAQETSKVEEKPSATEENKVIKEEEKDVEPKVEEESIIEETLTEAEPKEEIVNSAYIQTSTGRVNPTQPYHVIAGAFREKANAERFRDRLRENGNSNSEIIGEFDGLFIVSASSHQSMEEAQNSRKSNSTITQSWIFRWP